MSTFNAYNDETHAVNIALFTQTDAALAGLREKYSDLPEEVTAENYDLFKSGAKELSGLRTAIEKKRKEVKDPYLKAGKAIDDEAKRITAAISEIEAPVAALKSDWDERLKREKEARIARLQQKVDGITAFVKRAAGKDSLAISALLEELEQIDTANDFFDLTAEATKAQAETRDKLTDLLTERLQFEENERARAAAEKEANELRVAAEITQRISDIRMAPVQAIGKPLSAVTAQIEALKAMSFDGFSDREAEAKDAATVALQQLEVIANTAPADDEPEPQAEVIAESAMTDEAPAPQEEAPDEIVTEREPAFCEGESRSMLDAISHFCAVKGLSDDDKQELIDILDHFGVAL